MFIKLESILEGKFKQETAAEIFARYESLKKSHAAPELLAKVLKQANDQMDFEMKAKMKNLDAKYAGEDWWETVKTFYKIEERNNEWAIISDAKDWKEQKEWVYPTKYEAEEQLFKLIGYKIHDRKAGHGSEDKDFERADMLAKRRGVKEGFEVGDVVKVHQSVKGADGGLYGKFNIEKITPTMIVAYDHKTKETMKFNAKTLRGVGASDHLMIKEAVDAPSFRKWKMEVRAKFGNEVKYQEDQHGGGAVNRCIARLDDMTVATFNRKTGQGTIFSKSVKEGETFGQKVANKIMGAAPKEPKYKVGQRVRYETSPGQKDWKDGGRGEGEITEYKNGHYMINGNPVNHFEIKGVVKEAKDDRHYMFGNSEATKKAAMDMMKERFGEITKKNDQYGRWAFFNKDGVQVGLSEIDGEGDRTYNIFKSSTVKTVKESFLQTAIKMVPRGRLDEASAPWKANTVAAMKAEKKAQQTKDPRDYKKASEAHAKAASDPWHPDREFHKEKAAEWMARAKKLGLKEESVLHKALDRALSKEKKASPTQVEKNKERWAKIQAGKNSVDMEAVRALTDAGLEKMIKDFESYNRMGGDDGKAGLKALKDEAKRRDSAGHVEEGITDSIKAGVKSVKRGMQGWGDGVTPKGIKQRASEYSDDEVTGLAKSYDELRKTRATLPTSTDVPKHSPAGLQKRVLDREMKKRGLGEEEHKFGHEFAAFKKQLEKKHGPGNVRYQGDGNVTDAYHAKTGKHLGFIDGQHAEVKEAAEAKFVAYDVSHEPDGVMVLVMGPGDAGAGGYYGINVVFGKPGTQPQLVTSDKFADEEAKKYKAKIISVATKKLDKEELEHLASLK